MEVDGMYENTPWEHLALWAPWIGLAAVVLAVILYGLSRRTGRRDPSGAAEAFVPLHPIAVTIGALGLSLATLGVLFFTMWRAAHDTYPHAFGRAAAGVASGAIVVALLVGVWWRRWMASAIAYGALTASVAVAVAIASFSHSIIAEGQVTAMVLPVGYVVAAVMAASVAALLYRDAILHEAVSVLVFLAVAFVATQLLPVVQFHDEFSGSIYPVTGAFYIVALGRLARVWMLPRGAAWMLAAAAVAMGYLIGSWYGIAIAAVGLSISGALDPRRPPSAGFPLPRSGRA